MQWALVELANHPEVQNRLQKEIDDVVPEKRLPSLSDKPHLPYTEAVILEVLRRRTVVPFRIPPVSFKDAEGLGCFIPKGSLVGIYYILYHISYIIYCTHESTQLTYHNYVLHIFFSFSILKTSCTKIDSSSLKY